MSRSPVIVWDAVVRLHLWLLIYGVDSRTWSCPLAEGQNLVGRSHACNIRIPDCYVSKYHAVIERYKTAMHITDSNSRNGTYLNGKRIKEAAELHIGDTLQLGPVQNQGREGNRRWAAD